MPDQADLAAANIYASIMEEAKLRALSINTMTNSHVGLPVPLVREYCFLQLRMLCELVALGCLVAHGDLAGTKVPALQKAYKADEILKRLEALRDSKHTGSGFMSSTTVVDVPTETRPSRQIFLYLLILFDFQFHNFRYAAAHVDAI